MPLPRKSVPRARRAFRARRCTIVPLLGRAGRLALVLLLRRARRPAFQRSCYSSDAPGVLRSHSSSAPGGRRSHSSSDGGPALVLVARRTGRLALVLLLGAGRPALALLLGRVGRPAPVLLLGPRPSSSVARPPRWPSFSPVLLGLLRIRSRNDEIEKSEDV